MPVADINIRVDSAALERALREAPEHIRAEMEMALRDTVATFGKEYIRKKLSLNRGGAVQPRNPTGGISGALQWRTGSLAKSFGQRVVRTTRVEDLHAYVGFAGSATDAIAGVSGSGGGWHGSAKKYINIHQYGGTIRPGADKKFLTIPAPANLTGAKVQRWPSVPSMGDAARIIVNRAGTGGVVLEGDEGPVMWYLTREVTIPARLNFFGEWAAFRPRAVSRINVGIARALEAGRG